VLVALNEALSEFTEQGGILTRHALYSSNQSYLVSQFTALGFQLYIPKEIQGCIITTFVQPEDEKWNFEKYYQFLAGKRILIYPGKLAKKNSFRIGSIGELKRQDFEELVELTKEYLKENGIQVPLKY
jgi:2-aminoethylphosphonate-pyruvate transaminase